MSLLPGGRRLVEANDIITRVCVAQGVVPPALLLYCTARTYFDPDTNVIAMSKDSWFTDRWPSALYHELAHYIHTVFKGETDHNTEFFTLLVRILESEAFTDAYRWDNEYHLGVECAKVMGHLPADYDPKRHQTLEGFYRDIISRIPKAEEVDGTGEGAQDLGIPAQHTPGAVE